MMRVMVVMMGLLVGGCAFSPSARVAAFGDSVTWGYGGKPGGWVEELEDRWGHPIANLGVPGETIDDAADRIDSRLGLGQAPSARVVLVLHGGNDMNRAFQRSPCSRECDPSLVDEKYEEIGEHLERIRDVAENHDRLVVFATYWPASPEACSHLEPPKFAAFQAAIDRLNAEIVERAEAAGAPVVRLDELPLDEDPANYYDCLHPSGKGYAIIAERWLEDSALWAPD